MESLIYVIIHLYAGCLPWHSGVNKLSGRERIDYVIEMKRTLDIREYAPHVPGRSYLFKSKNQFLITLTLESIIKSYQHVRSLSYSDKPDYDLIRHAILDEMKMYDLVLNSDFEWVTRTFLPL